MLIVLLEYTENLAATEAYLAEHIAYLKWYYQAGAFVMSGRKQPRTGGIILVKALDRGQVEKLTAEDPFHREDVAEYTITEPIPTKVAEGLENYSETIQTDFLEGYCPKNNIKKESIIFTLYGETFSSWLPLGTATYSTPEILKQFVQIAQPAIITISLRRTGSGSETRGQSFWSLLEEVSIPALPNTAGCRSVWEVVITAQMAREMFDTDWIKPELIDDGDTLQPDVLQLVETIEILIKDGLKALPYYIEDLIAYRHLLDASCQALMPWTVSISTGSDVVHAYALKVLRKHPPDTPLTVDVGLGLPSQAAQVMEWGSDGVLLNIAVSRSGDPVNVARTFALAVESGRPVYEAGPMEACEKVRANILTVSQPFWHSAEY